MAITKVAILGAGQFGRLILELAKRTKKFECVGFLDPAPRLQNALVDGIPILGGDDALASLQGKVDAIFLAIANGQRRAAMLDKARSLGFQVPTLIDPSVILASNVELGEGVLISMGTTILNACRIGDGVIVGTGVTILHDVNIGAFCTLGGGAIVGAGSQIEDHAFLGVGAVIASGGFRVGTKAKMAAGAVALKDVPSESMAIGNPARVIANYSEPAHE
jgi:sugar O-acyltransferase (sialic acid O-acetyltransferase NeuD family)